MAEPLSRLFEQPCPDVATVIGKGPSLDRYTVADALGPVFAINEAALVVPCDYAVYLDRAGNQFSLSATPIRPRKYESAHDQRGYIIDRDELGRRHTSVTSSATMALLGQWGVRRVLCVGFDGVDGIAGNAQCVVPLAAHAKRNHNESYRRHANKMEVAVNEYGIAVKWFHRQFMQCADEDCEWLVPLTT